MTKQQIIISLQKCSLRISFWVISVPSNSMGNAEAPWCFWLHYIQKHLPSFVLANPCQKFLCVSVCKSHTERSQNKRGGKSFDRWRCVALAVPSFQGGDSGAFNSSQGGPKPLFRHVPVSPLQIGAGMSSWLYMRALFRSSDVKNSKRVFFFSCFFNIFTQRFRTTSTVALPFFQSTAAHSSCLLAS